MNLMFNSDTIVNLDTLGISQNMDKIQSCIDKHFCLDNTWKAIQVQYTPDNKWSKAYWELFVYSNNMDILQQEKLISTDSMHKQLSEHIKPSTVAYRFVIDRLTFKKNRRLQCKFNYMLSVGL